MLENKTVALLGGDRRELQVVPALAKAGYRLKIFGLPAGSLPSGAQIVSSLREAVSCVDAVIMPLPGVNNKGFLHAPLVGEIAVGQDDLAVLPPGTPVIVGFATSYLRGLADDLGLKLIEIMEMDDIAVPNAIPTAEGAIQLAMERLPMTINGLPCLVIGYGRVGMALAARLRALGAVVTVVNRRVGRLALAAKDGFKIYPWENLGALLPQIKAVFNSVPHMVLDKTKLAALPKDALVIDLASIPGGTDFAAAQELGLEVVHALSLPGKVAPITAGQVLAGFYPRLLASLLADNGSWKTDGEVS